MNETPVWLTPAEFAGLPEYSCSIPTGTTIGKRWKCNRNAYEPLDPDRTDPLTGALLPWPKDWWLGEYVEIGMADRVGIDWRPIIVIEAPEGE